MGAGWVSVEYKTLIAIEWRESQTYILHSYAPYLTACWRNLCVQRLTRKVVCASGRGVCALSGVCTSTFVHQARIKRSVRP